MNFGIFLDRDGVINANTYNNNKKKWESPHEERQFCVHSGVLFSIRRLIAGGFKVFIVSNQPSYAKGKTSLENIMAISRCNTRKFNEVGIELTDEYYCLHHPDGIMDGYNVQCECRKPSSYFLLKAISEHDICTDGSWMVGDRDTDVICGRNAGCQTVQILTDHQIAARSVVVGDYWASNVVHAVDIILDRKRREVNLGN